MPSLVEIGLVVLEKKIFKPHLVYFRFSLEKGVALHSKNVILTYPRIPCAKFGLLNLFCHLLSPGSPPLIFAVPFQTR